MSGLSMAVLNRQINWCFEGEAAGSDSSIEDSRLLVSELRTKGNEISRFRWNC